MNRKFFLDPVKTFDKFPDFALNRVNGQSTWLPPCYCPTVFALPTSPYCACSPIRVHQTAVKTLIGGLAKRPKNSFIPRLNGQIRCCHNNPCSGRGVSQPRLADSVRWVERMKLRNTSPLKNGEHRVSRRTSYDRIARFRHVR